MSAKVISTCPVWLLAAPSQQLHPEAADCTLRSPPQASHRAPRARPRGSLVSSEIPAIMMSQQMCALIMRGLALHTLPLSSSHLRDPVSHGIGSIIVPFYRTENGGTGRLRDLPRSVAVEPRLSALGASLPEATTPLSSQALSDDFLTHEVENFRRHLPAERAPFLKNRARAEWAGVVPRLEGHKGPFPITGASGT